jgi:hypothetical protein
MGISSFNVQNSMGANGSVYVNGTSATTGNFIAIQFTEDSVIGAITGQMDNSAGLISDNITFNKNDCIYLPFTSLTLVSGAAILYKA